jgi:peptidoglycan/LPS O-acetylase OafA/YrhL
MLEYLASAAFALLLWRMKRKGLIALVALAAMALGVAAFHLGGLSAGFDWTGAKYGLIRIAFSFSLGLLLFRSGWVIRSRFGFWTLSLIMILLFIGPRGTPWAFNWVYDFAVVTIALPLLVALGAGARVSGPTRAVCELSGRVSYPIYMVHYAAVMVFANYCWSHDMKQQVLPWVIGAMTLGLVVCSCKRNFSAYTLGTFAAHIKGVQSCIVQ